MKKNLTTLMTAVFFIASMQSYAQTEAGKVFIGGKTNANMLSVKSKVKGSNLEDKGSMFNFSPQVGMFITNNVALGVEIDISSSKSESDDYNSKYKSNAFGPIIQIYGGSNSVNPFFGAGIKFGNSTSEINSPYWGNETSSSDLFSFKFELGVAFFLNENASLNTGLNYVSTKYKRENDYERTEDAFGLVIGFNLFL